MKIQGKILLVAAAVLTGAFASTANADSLAEIQCREARPASPGRGTVVTINVNNGRYEASISRGRMALGFFRGIRKTVRMGGTSYAGRNFDLNIALVSRGIAGGRRLGDLDATPRNGSRIVVQDMLCNFVR